MSINSLANAAAARRLDTPPLNAVPRTLDQIAKAAVTPPRRPATLEHGVVAPAAPAAPAATTPVDTTFNVLFGYIPTEVLTLYVAVLAAVGPNGAVTAAGWSAFWIFLALTPLVVWLVFAAKLKMAAKPLPLRFAAWPVWEMFAATAAYAAWAFALPNAPFTQYGWYSSSLSGLAVLIVSTVLGLLAPFFQRPLGG